MVVEWSVLLPTYWGILVQWGGKYFGPTVGGVSECPIHDVPCVTLPLYGCVPPALVHAMVRHGAMG